MKKTTTYARKRAVQERQAQHVTLATLIKADLQSLQTDAGIHTWTGDNGAKMVNLSGRLCFITAYAAKASGFAVDHPDIRIVRGMASALGDMAADLDGIERYRASLQSGLAAINRLLPLCDLMEVVQGSLKLDSMLATNRGMGTADVYEALGVAA